ncbi:MAG: hypothetical protein JSS49_05350 [Planctomycetes bacterium]|nr:hypothetical protein [Planctomycetota bacterium]
MSDKIARLVSQYDQDLATAVDWWRSRSVEDRINLLRLLCDRRVPITAYKGLNDEALKILRDLAALAVARLVIGSGPEDEVVL